MTTELLTIIDRSDQGNLRIAGLVARDVAHSRGVPHGSALVAVVVARAAPQGHVPCTVLQKRPSWQDVCPGLWDTFGGHLAGGQGILSQRASWEDRAYIERLYDETALREINEECLVTLGKGRDRWRFHSRHLMRFGKVGEFEYGLEAPRGVNCEYSSFYGAFIPPDVLSLGPDEPITRISACERATSGDTDRPADVEPICLPWPELVGRFSHAAGEFADGIARALSRAAGQPGLMQAMDEFFRRGLHAAGVATAGSQ